MKELKVRKIGNSLGSIFPKEWQVEDGAKLEYRIDKEKHQVIIDLEPENIKHDRKLIEKSFEDFDNGNWMTDKEMKAKFGKYGWGK